MKIKFFFLIFRVENLEKFARDLVAGNLEAYLKSEPIPESNPDAVRVSFLMLKHYFIKICSNFPYFKDCCSQKLQRRSQR